MLNRTTIIWTQFEDALPPSTEYRLENVRLEIPDERTAIFKARLIGPAGSNVWARAWLGSEAEGTLAETASARMNAGDEVTLIVKLTRGKP